MRSLMPSENPVQSDRIFGWHQASHILTSLVLDQQNVNHTGRTATQQAELET